jgi:aminoglycoside 6'-N-acetyltransferase
MASAVVLRPPTPDEVELLLRVRQTPEGTGPLQWYGFPSDSRLRARAAAFELITSERGILAVLEGDQLAGSVEWFRSAWGPMDASWCWSIAIGLRPEFRGRGLGRSAQRQLVEYLFAHTVAERVQAWTDITNTAEQRALEAVGFVREGIIRRGQWRSGAWHDQVIYSVLRGEPLPQG